MFVRKVLAGRHPVYQMLQKDSHPCLPKLYEVAASDDYITVIEEYIEGQSCGAVELSERQFRQIVRELVLDADLAIKGSVLDDPFLYQLADQLAQRDR